MTLEIVYQCGVRLKQGIVKEVHNKKIVLSDGTDVPYGLLVWSTGVGPSEFVKSLNLPESPGGRYIFPIRSCPLLCIQFYNELTKWMYVYRIGVDEWLRVPSVEDVFALGDCAGFLEQTGKQVLPALAQVIYICIGCCFVNIYYFETNRLSLTMWEQVAERQGKYLMELFNRMGKENGGKAWSRKDIIPMGEPFVYRHLGSMASVGRYKALVDLRPSKVSS